MTDHFSFSIKRSQLRNRVLIPKYYDPELSQITDTSAKQVDLIELSALLAPGNVGSRLGTWVPRENYGGGDVPYVRTSDLHAWRLKPDFKKSVSRAVYDANAARQDVKPGDILMVAHGTYLVGTVAIVAADDTPLMIQDHVFRLRTKNGGDVTPELLLAALSTRFVRRQVRSKQFSADIIDKIGERHLELKVPIPKSKDVRDQITTQVRGVVALQTDIRTRLKALLGSDLRMTRERSQARHSFRISRAEIVSRILIPKYYDPELTSDIADAQNTENWMPLSALVEKNWLSVGTGVEVGKMAYGTGTVPFIRTTDLADLGVKADPRQGISDDIYRTYAKKAGVEVGDILVVRDGTYLVGSSAIVTTSDTPALICGGIYRIRVQASSKVDPFAILALLNLPIVRRQMRAKQFTRDVIDTLGKRFLEVLVPDPTSKWATNLGASINGVVDDRGRVNAAMRQVIEQLEPAPPAKLSNRPGWSMRG
jgi:hypothetical protein